MQSLTILSGRERLSAELSLPEVQTNRIAIMLHGGPGGNKRGPADIFMRLANSATKLNLASLRFDFRGSGESNGDPVEATLSTQVEDMAAGMAWARNHGYTRLCVIGESLGATVALLGYSPQIEALVLLWPAIYLMQTDLTDYLTPERLAEFREYGFIRDGDAIVGQKFIEECKSTEVEPYLRRVMSPTLLIHGDADKSVGCEQSRRAYALIPGSKELVIVQGGEHGLRKPQEQDKVEVTVTGWLQRHFA